MKILTLVVALAAVPLASATTAGAASGPAPTFVVPAETGQTGDTSARRKLRRYRHVNPGYRSSYGYDRTHQGYYRGVRPGWGYGPDPGDYAWPPFHFKPYW